MPGGYRFVVICKKVDCVVVFSHDVCTTNDICEKEIYLFNYRFIIFLVLKH